MGTGGVGKGKLQSQYFLHVYITNGILIGYYSDIRKVVLINAMDKLIPKHNK